MWRSVASTMWEEAEQASKEDWEAEAESAEQEDVMRVRRGDMLDVDTCCEGPEVDDAEDVEVASRFSARFRLFCTFLRARRNCSYLVPFL